ncbi:MAG: hypothetical protein ABC596_09850 [Candidatus Methanosuratincola petrocarbonis]
MPYDKNAPFWTKEQSGTCGSSPSGCFVGSGVEATGGIVGAGVGLGGTVGAGVGLGGTGLGVGLGSGLDVGLGSAVGGEYCSEQYSIDSTILNGWLMLSCTSL